MTPSPPPPGQSAFQPRVQLNDVDPVVWRRLIVPGSVRMAKLSEMLLAAMGWTNSHLHAFRVGDVRYGMNADEYSDGEIDEKQVTVLQALRDERRFVYDYDFGDGWEHDVVIEDLSWTSFGLKFAVCIDGERACPPEDVGGPWGYSEFLAAIADPHHEEHESHLEWVGGSFDPARFDLATANAALPEGPLIDELVGRPGLDPGTLRLKGPSPPSGPVRTVRGGPGPGKRDVSAGPCHDGPSGEIRGRL